MCIKVQHKPIKDQSWGSKDRSKRNRRAPWSGAPDCLVCHRTVSDAPGSIDSELFTFGFLHAHSAIIHRTVRCATGLSGAPSEATATSATVICKSVNSAWSMHAEVRAGVRGAPDSEQCLSGAAPDCPVWHEVSTPTVETARTLTVGWRGWRTGQCPVHPLTDSLPNGYVVVEGYKYPPTTTIPSIQVFQTSHSLQELVQSIQDTIQKNQSLSKSQIHSKPLVTRERVLLVFFELLFLDRFLLPHSCSLSGL
jgi:hypothetical protein